MRLLVLAFVVSGLAFGHTGMMEHGGVGSGFLHPVSGLDHILAMIGVGMVAFHASMKKHLLLVAFMGAMILAAVAGRYGIPFFGVEEGILLSVAVVFALIGFADRLSLSILFPVIAFFGLFHGYAHGAEFGTGSFISFITGFSISTLLLHLTGIALASVIARTSLIKRLARETNV